MSKEPILIDNVKRKSRTNMGIWLDKFGRNGVGDYDKVNELYNRLFDRYENGICGEFDDRIRYPEYDIIFLKNEIVTIPEGTTILETKYNNYTTSRYVSNQDEFQIKETETNIVAFGIVGYVFTKLNPSLYSDGFYFNQIPQLGTAEFYQFFFDEQFENFKKERADAWRADLVEEFLPLHIQRLKNCIPEAKDLFTFFPQKEKIKVMKYVDNYFEYLNQKYPTTFSSTINPKQIKENTMLNYKQVVLNAFLDNKEQKTPLKSYFKREAKLAEIDNFIENNDFINGCLHVIKLYKNEIQNQYQKRLTENDSVAKSINSGNGMKIDGVLVTDIKDERLQSALKEIDDNKKFVESRGYKNNLDYPCNLSTTGEITDDIFSQEVKLHWHEIELIEKSILETQESMLDEVKDFTDGQNQKKIISFKDFFLIKDVEKIDSIITMIDNELQTSKSKALTLALYTVALQHKNYLSKTINQTKFHETLIDTFGKEKVSGRPGFSEKYSEVNKGLYEEQLKNYINLIP